MNEPLTIRFERADDVDQYKVRGIVFGVVKGQRKVIAMYQERTVQKACSFLLICNPEVSAVELPDGSLDDGGELSLTETAVLAWSHLEA